MIRINLLGAPKPKNKRSAVPTVSLEMGEPGSARSKVLIMVALVAIANWAYWNRLDKQSKAIARNMQLAEQKNRELQMSRPATWSGNARPITTSAAWT